MGPCYRGLEHVFVLGRNRSVHRSQTPSPLARRGCLAQVEVRPLVHVYPPGHGRRTILLDFVENLSGRLVETGSVDPDELEALKRSLHKHLNDPEIVVVSHLFIQAWGHKR